jgi:hypothetical protein
MVTDKKTGEGLPCAVVQFSGTRLGGITDLPGSYAVIQIPPGTYAVEVSMLGYETVKIKKVQIQPDRIKHLNIKLKQHVITMPKAQW